ncbi:MAG: molybdenum cofactor guanylyltransferase [Bacteroidota bacterium]
MKNLLGVVLCGGQSKRMGSDKGLMPVDDTIWAKKVGGKLSALAIPVVYSINETQYELYQQHVEPQQLIIDNAAAAGPLKGLLSVHEKFPEKNLLLMACDMLDMNKETIEETLIFYQHEPGYDFYVHQDAEFVQPFCGIYRATGLAAELAKAESHQLTKFSMQHLLNGANTKRLPIKDATAFHNYNERIHS